MENKRLDFCLLIPCYNNFAGLLFSLRSIFYDADRFTVVIIDNGSTPPISAKQIQSEIKNIDSMVVLRNEENKGIAEALNVGLKWIEEHLTVKYIARLDCGDYCSAHRFYRQVDYMNDHPEVGLLGSWCVFQDKHLPYRYRYRTASDPTLIIRQMHWKNVFIHPTVIFRADMLKISGYYPTRFLHAEDYAFFWRLIKIAPAHILDEYLVTCEINKKRISSKNKNKQLLARAHVINEYATSSLLKVAGVIRLKTLSIIRNG